jgi:anti-anti-sigma regulatory factor
VAAIHPRDRFRTERESPPTHARQIAVTQSDDRGTWLVTLHGELDIATIPLLDQQTCHVWPRCKVAVIDLSEITFIDSSMIHWLLRVERVLEAAQCSTLSIVTGPPGCVAQKLFQRLRMSYVLACYPTRRDAFTQAVAGADAFASPTLATHRDSRTRAA